MGVYKLKQGYDLRLAGDAPDTVTDAPYPTSVALHPVEFHGLRPKLAVAVGDTVKAGTPLFYDKGNESLTFASPASGTVSAINRGHRRVLESIVVETDGNRDSIEHPTFGVDQLAGIDRDELVNHILKAGLFHVFRQRPFDHVANPAVTPRAIFVSAFNSGPLTIQENLLLEGNEDYVKAALAACKRLSGGEVHVSVRGGSSKADFFGAVQGVDMHQFFGPHPSGAVGVQIHHIDPIRGRNDAVWTINVQSLIVLGKLLLTGRFAPETTVALAGTGSLGRGHFRTIIGADLNSLVQGNIINKELRYISGDALTGRDVGKDGHLCFYDSTVTLIPESVDGDFIGWMLPGLTKESSYRVFLSGMPFMKNKRFAADTKLNGGHRALVLTGAYEKVLPMDIYPMFLIKAIMAEDFEEMEGLGIYEVAEEDMALCEYVCPSKTSIQKILRDGLDLVYKEG
jgi:Na+-transporting NADH:ubiquinone oxidoreductase subunit A